MSKIETRQSLKKNIFSVLIARIVTPVSSLFLIICVARILGPEELGKYSLVLSFLLLFQILPTFGLNYYITREVSKNNSKISSYLVHGIILFIGSGLSFAFFLNIIVHFLSYSTDVKYGLFMVSLAIIPSALIVLCEALLMGIERMGSISTVNLTEGVFRSLVSITGVLFLGLGFYWLVFVLLLSRFFLCFLLLYTLRKKISTPFNFSMSVILELLKASKIFFGINIFAVLNSRIDFIIISVVAGLTNLGYYSVSYRIVESASLISGAVVSAFYPVLSRLHSENQDKFSYLFHKLLRLITLFFIPLSVGLFFYADFIISLLFSDVYHEAVIILRIMSLFSFLYAIDQAFATATLTSNKQKSELLILSISFCCYATILFILVPIYGLMGAAISTVLAMLIQTAIKCNFICKKIVPIKFFSILWQPILFLVIPILCFSFIKSDIIGGVLGTAVYILFLFLFSEFSPKQQALLKREY